MKRTVSTRLARYKSFDDHLLRCGLSHITLIPVHKDKANDRPHRNQSAKLGRTSDHPCAGCDGLLLLDRFRAGEDGLCAIEAAELGPIGGKKILHLQCHIGYDTLCLVRRGAIATGLDFSAEALRIARCLASEASLKVDFVQSKVDETPRLTPGPFDLVFVTWGTICWLPDLTVWARVIATVLVPGGELYLADAHPGFLLTEERGGRLEPTYDFQTPVDRPLEFKCGTTYTRDPTVLRFQSTREWIHALSTILGALIEAGCRNVRAAKLRRPSQAGHPHWITSACASRLGGIVRPSDFAIV